MSTPLLSVARYLVLKKMAGEDDVVEALYRYLVLDVSPTIVADSVGIPKRSLFSFKNRLCEKSMGITRARIFLKFLYPAIQVVKTIAERRGDTLVCKLCGFAAKTRTGLMEMHIDKEHRELVEEELGKVLQILRVSIRR